MRHVLIVGATSAIAEACARLWAGHGAALFLVGRDPRRLDAIAADLRVRGSPEVYTHSMDAIDYTGHAPMFEAAALAMGGFDVLLIAHGTLSDQAACELDADLMRAEIHTNALSAVSLLTLAAGRVQPGGVLAVISSVAGDRGRQSNYVYGSAKAMVTAFASGLRQRLSKTGIAVLTVKPGFVDTPMTAAFTKGALWARPAAVAARIVQACEAGRSGELYVPWFWWGIMRIITAIPESVFRRIRL